MTQQDHYRHGTFTCDSEPGSAAFSKDGKSQPASLTHRESGMLSFLPQQSLQVLPAAQSLLKVPSTPPPDRLWKEIQLPELQSCWFLRTQQIWSPYLSRCSPDAGASAHHHSGHCHSEPHGISSSQMDPSLAPWFLSSSRATTQTLTGRSLDLFGSLSASPLSSCVSLLPSGPSGKDPCWE